VATLWRVSFPSSLARDGADLPAEAAVDFKRLGTILIIGGVAVIVAAVAWWFAFYSAIMSELSRAPNAPPGGNSVFNVISCLYSSQDVCGFIAGFARLLGRTPYEPMLLWLGLGGLVVGVVVRLAARPAAGRP
jgi:hypothetical protein